MSARPEEFKVGDKAVVPNLGVGVCTELTTIDVEGEPYEVAHG